MQEIIHAFGVDWRLIVIQVFNFSVLIGVLWYFLYTPILTLLREREHKIRTGIENAEKAAQALADAHNEKMRIIGEAHTEAVSIVSKGTLRAEAKEKELFEEASRKAAHHVLLAEKEAVEIKKKAQKESDTEITKLTLLGVEKMLHERSI